MFKTVLLVVLFCLVSLIYTQDKYVYSQNWKGLQCSGQPIRPPSRGKLFNCERSGGGYQMTTCNGTHVTNRGKCADTNCRSCGIVQTWEVGKCYPIRTVNQSSKYLRCSQNEESK